MTNQEAIERIQSIKSKVSLYDDVVALRMSEEALEIQNTGHWIYIGNSEITGLKIVECSECGKRTYGSGKFCPNCGAKMEGENK